MKLIAWGRGDEMTTANNDVDFPMHRWSRAVVSSRLVSTLSLARSLWAAVDVATAAAATGTV